MLYFHLMSYIFWPVSYKNLPMQWDDCWWHVYCLGFCVFFLPGRESVMVEVLGSGLDKIVGVTVVPNSQNGVQPFNTDYASSSVIDGAPTS